MARENKANRQERRMAQRISNSIEIATGHQLTVKETSGPIPDPETLRKYNETHPGLAERIVKMAEEESLHRRELEKKIVVAQTTDIQSQRSEIRIGQICALFVAVFGFGCGTYAMAHGAQIGGSVLSGGTLVSLVGAFLLRQHSASKTPKPSPQPDNQAGEIKPEPIMRNDANPA